MAQFLSDDYMTEATAALSSHAGFAGAIANTQLALQFVVTDGPDGESRYYVEVRDGAAAMASGDLADAEVTITSTFDTAVAISKGELNTQMAFVTGKITVGGNMAQLMMNATVLGEFANALSDLPVEY